MGDDELGIKRIYENPLVSKASISDWIQEGVIEINETEEGLKFSNGTPEEKGDFAHWTIWLPEKFPNNVIIEWEFKPVREPGLCMVFFSALGKNGESIFNEKLTKRNGYYPHYHSGDINTYHISYFRHKYESERAFRTCNLRKSAGFHFVSQGADPLPPTEDAIDFYKIKVVKFESKISFYINELLIFDWVDNGKDFGPVLEEGYIGFRQMAPMSAIYRNLKISEIIKREE